MNNEKANTHQPNLSINSLSSIIEPMTPPDYGHDGNSSNDQYRFPQFQDHQTQQNLSHHSSGRSNTNSTPDSLINGSSISPAVVSFNQASPINISIGGNKFRSRFKSLPTMGDLDHKFSNITLNPVAQDKENQLQPSPVVDTISHIRTRSVSQLPHTRNHSIASGTITSFNSISTNNSLAKNFDELNLIPVENLDILRLSVDQYGCRFLQKRIEVDNNMVVVVFNKIFNNLLDLIIDPFGNYLIQKLVDYLLPFQKDLMIEKIHSHLFLIAVNQYGTRSLQKIIDTVSNSYQMDLIVKGLQYKDTVNLIEDNNVVKLIKDLNGNHVIQKCIYKFPPEKIQFIIDSICLSNNIVRISTHKHGCCVLQKLLNNSDFNQILKISKVLLIYLDELINDQFGNYIIQFLFELNFLKSSEKINFLIDEFFNKMFNNLVRLSCLKFSSNVIEKFIKILKTKQNYVYLTAIIKLTNSNFDILIKDKFGNYVIQTLLDQFYDVNELNFEMTNLITNIKKFLPLIKTAPYGKKMQSKVQQLEACHNQLDPRYQFQQFNSLPEMHQSVGNYNYTSQYQPAYADYHSRHNPYYNIPVGQYNEAVHYTNHYNTGGVGNFVNSTQ